MNINDLKVFKMDNEKLELGFQQPGVSISLGCPEFSIDGKTFGAGAKPTAIDGCIQNEDLIQVSFEPLKIGGNSAIETILYLKWYSAENVLRKRCRFRIIGNGAEIYLGELVLDRVKISGSAQGSPAVAEGFYSAIEYPLTDLRIENGAAVLADKSGYKVKPGEWYDSKTAVYGITPNGREKDAYTRYTTSRK